MRMGDIYKSETEVKRRSLGSSRVPLLPALRAGWNCGPTYLPVTYTHSQTYTGLCPTRPLSVTACVTRPRSATRSLSHSHSPSHTRCHTPCLTHSYSGFSLSALALWRHLEVSVKLGNSLPVFRVWYPRIQNAPLQYDVLPFATYRPRQGVLGQKNEEDFPWQGLALGVEKPVMG